MHFTAIFGHIIGQIEELLCFLPVFLVKFDVSHTQKAFKLHTDGPELFGDIYAVLEVDMSLLHVTFEQVCDGKLTITKRHTFLVVAWHRNFKSLFKLGSRSMILTKQARADSCVVNGNEFVVFVGLLGVLAVVHVAKIVLFAFEEDHSQSVKGQSTPYVIIEHASAKIEPFIVLTCLRQLALLLT